MQVESRGFEGFVFVPIIAIQKGTPMSIIVAVSEQRDWAINSRTFSKIWCRTLDALRRNPDVAAETVQHLLECETCDCIFLDELDEVAYRQVARALTDAAIDAAKHDFRSEPLDIQIRVEERCKELAELLAEDPRWSVE